MRTFCWWMCARLEQPVGSAVCEEHLAEEADEFLESLLNTFCASAEHLICLISPPPAIASQCFSPGLSHNLCTYEPLSLSVLYIIHKYKVDTEMKKQRGMAGDMSKLCSIPTCDQV